MDTEILKYVNDPNFCKTLSKFNRLKHGASYLLCLFKIEELKK
jgi:hypothetical protein